MEFIKNRMDKCQTFEELESVMSERKMIVHMYVSNNKHIEYAESGQKS